MDKAVAFPTKRHRVSAAFDFRHNMMLVNVSSAPALKAFSHPPALRSLRTLTSLLTITAIHHNPAARRALVMTADKFQPRLGTAPGAIN